MRSEGRGQMGVQEAERRADLGMPADPEARVPGRPPPEIELGVLDRHVQQRVWGDRVRDVQVVPRAAVKSVGRGELRSPRGSKSAHQLKQSTQADMSTWSAGGGGHQEGWHFSCERETIMERQVHFQSLD